MSLNLKQAESLACTHFGVWDKDKGTACRKCYDNLAAAYREAVEALESTIEKHYLWLHPGDEPEACAPCGLRVEIEAVLAKARERDLTRSP